MKTQDFELHKDGAVTTRMEKQAERCVKCKSINVFSNIEEQESGTNAIVMHCLNSQCRYKNIGCDPKEDETPLKDHIADASKKVSPKSISLGVASPLGDGESVRKQVHSYIEKIANVVHYETSSINNNRNLDNIYKQLEIEESWFIDLIESTISQAITEREREIKSLLPSRLDPVSKEDLFDKIDEVLSHLQEKETK